MLPSIFGRDDQGFGALMREFERVFDDFTRRSPFSFYSTQSGVLNPHIDVSETPEAVEITAELPGVQEKDIDVTLSNGVLTIRGEKKVEREEKNKDWHVTERSSGSFVRSVPISFEPDQGAVEATFDNAVLKIRISKPKDAVKRTAKIPIKTGK
jgi:HSP20 family protein